MNFALFKQVAAEVLSGAGSGVTKTSKAQLNIKPFFDPVSGKRLVAIEQNPARPSQFAAQARAGSKIVQIKEAGTGGKYVAAVVNGEVIPFKKRA